jgi:hypothetical protein
VGSATNADNAAHAGAADTATNAVHATAADNATHAGTADNIAPPEAWHEIGAAGEQPFLGGSANYGSLGAGVATGETAAFYKGPLDVSSHGFDDRRQSLGELRHT